MPGSPKGPNLIKANAAAAKAAGPPPKQEVSTTFNIHVGGVLVKKVSWPGLYNFITFRYSSDLAVREIYREHVDPTQYTCGNGSGPEKIDHASRESGVYQQGTGTKGVGSYGGFAHFHVDTHKQNLLRSQTRVWWGVFPTRENEYELWFSNVLNK